MVLDTIKQIICDGIKRLLAGTEVSDIQNLLPSGLNSPKVVELRTSSRFANVEKTQIEFVAIDIYNNYRLF